MRHKYASPAVVVARSPLGERAVLLTLLTGDLGLIRARAEGLRKPGAKLAHALQTFSESEVTLVRGKDGGGWRAPCFPITGAARLRLAPAPARRA